VQKTCALVNLEVAIKHVAEHWIVTVNTYNERRRSVGEQVAPCKRSTRDPGDHIHIWDTPRTRVGYQEVIKGNFASATLPCIDRWCTLAV
jgi:hypothetical protein